MYVVLRYGSPVLAWLWYLYVVFLCVDPLCWTEFVFGLGFDVSCIDEQVLCNGFGWLFVLGLTTLEKKCLNHPPPAPNESAVGAYPTITQISRTPRHWEFTQHHRTSSNTSSVMGSA